MINASMFSSVKETWETPQDFYDKLNKEFGFTLDPCCLPESAKCAKFYTPSDDGLKQEWAEEIVFMNPPYGRQIGVWIKKAYTEAQKGATVVCLIPARTDTSYWHQHCMLAKEIRLVKGRLKFGGAKAGAPFPSALVIFAKGEYQPTFKTYIP